MRSSRLEAPANMFICGVQFGRLTSGRHTRMGYRPYPLFLYLFGGPNTIFMAHPARVGDFKYKGTRASVQIKGFLPS